MELRDSPEIEPERADEPRSRSGRRFARLIGPPAARRVALPRLIVAVVLSLSLTALVGVGGSKLLQSAASWVARRPEHRISFARIELVPPPEPWLRRGSSRILEEVRKEAKLDETLSLLDFDLKEFEKDFRRHVWVKDVLRIDRSEYGRLIVELAYRKPVAVVRLEGTPPEVFVLDEEAVVLPANDIAWKHDVPPYLVEGMDGPLIRISGLSSSSPRPKPGVPWKRKVEGDALDDPDPLVLGAARLARFLQDRKRSPGSPEVTPVFDWIYLPQGPDEPFFLVDPDENLVCWGKPLGDEKHGEPSAEARWAMLLEWLRTRGPLVAKNPDYLYFSSTEARLRSESKSSRKKGLDRGSSRSKEPR